MGNRPGKASCIQRVRVDRGIQNTTFKWFGIFQRDPDSRKNMEIFRYYPHLLCHAHSRDYDLFHGQIVRIVGAPNYSGSLTEAGRSYLYFGIPPVGNNIIIQGTTLLLLDD
jgi:hypothetical protein